MGGRRGSEGEFSLGKQTEEQQQQNIRMVNTGESNTEGKIHLKHCAVHNAQDSNREMPGGNIAKKKKQDVRSTNFPLNKRKSG